MGQGSAAAGAVPNLAERLGFAADARVAVVHVDDLGMCHAANDGGFEALRNGPATCGSLMVPCPWFAEAAERTARHPELDLGVHLTLNAEWASYRWGPVAGRDVVPSLCASDGGLLRTTAETLAAARPEEVEIELRAQVEKALAAGIDVTHLDSHMGTLFLPPFVPIYAKLARQYALPVFAMRPTAEQVERALQSRGVAALLAAVEEIEAAGIPVLDAFDADSLSFAPGEGLAHNRRRIAQRGPGVTYLICHAARGGPELDGMMDNGHCREFERTFYGGEAGALALEEAGVQTVGMRPLRELVRGG